ncbi:Superoxide dismutase [Linderina macrospora]|uniref:Superoxide dismutase n=1 Tax=Linderina macrospora TaxID=4868 RepID=A0ACC1J6R8_9FUNG|nr:Superoxide dismutase [Linderina macrospora]
MKFISLAIAALATATAYAADSSSVATKATADLKGKAGISAQVEFSQTAKGVSVKLTATGLKSGVLYPYHIHVSPVPADGNCTATGGHLDPAKIKVADKPYKCDAKDPAKTCELGDLASRHGNLTADASGKAAVSYVDSVLAFSGADTILEHSVVIHGADNARLACGNIVVAKAGDVSSAAEESEASSAYLASGAMHQSASKEHNSVANDVEKSTGGASSVAAISGIVALVAAAFAI